MFVFWYCHKRGKEVRLAREAEGKAVEAGEEGEEEVEVSDTADEDEVEEMVEELEKADSQGLDEKADVLNQPAPAEVPLPEGETKGDGEEAKGSTATKA